MDKFIQNFLEFKKFGPAIERRDVPQTSLDKYRGKLPDKLLEYWQQFGWCAFAKGLLWIVDPEEWEDEIDGWIGETPFMERDAFHVIARTAFGELILWGEKTGQSLKIVTAWGTIFPAFDQEEFAEDGPDLTLQLFFSSRNKEAHDLTDEEGLPLFERALAKLGTLSHTTMYGFVPALALGGEVRLDRLQKLDAHVHLDILSQVTELQVMTDVAQAAKG